MLFENMFLTLLVPVLLSLTTLSLGNESSQNCTRIINVTNHNWNKVKIKKTEKEKVITCFKAENGNVHLSLNTYYQCKGYDDFHFLCLGKRCKYPHPEITVYEGCEGRGTSDKVEYECDYLWPVRWVSKSDCLKVVSESSDGPIDLEYKLFNEDDDYDPCWGTWEKHRPSKRCREWYRWWPGGYRRRTPPLRRTPSVRRKPPLRRTPSGRRTPPKATPKLDVDKTFEEESGGFKSPNYPGKYRKNLKCIYDIKLDANKRIELIFRDLDLGQSKNGSECTEDYIAIYDGINKWSGELHKFCGNDTRFFNKPILSKNNELRVEFKSGSKDGNNKGFNASYSVYQQPAAKKEIKITGVIIGTVCGLLLFGLTLLAIWRSKNSTELQVLSDILNGNPDAIQKKAPPSYDDVMASPETYPVSPDSKDVRWVEEPENGEPPPYPGLAIRTEPGDELQEPDSKMSDDDDVGLPRDIEAQEEVKSHEPDVGKSDVKEESKAKESDFGEKGNEKIYAGEIKDRVDGKSDVGEEVVEKSDVGERVVRNSNVEEHIVGESDVGKHVAGESDVSECVVGKIDIGEHVVEKSDVGEYVVGKSDVGEYVVGESDVGERIIGESDVSEHVVGEGRVGGPVVTESNTQRVVEKGSSFGITRDVKIDVPLEDFKGIEGNNEKVQQRVGVQENTRANTIYF
ncbi:uncharacterized protein LOC114522747 isoform X2 [Dendronephthya gigantea]|uniref:uncharacterized protein LOC114522747 isoform X2 n=1 Tax=Dendronephthya gigantea TaxID=151771 RepID=UPI00106A6CE5|nr:uncharacterized protein LOC114522747 isoform X2 [Dendronephthya gigantea]